MDKVLEERLATITEHLVSFPTVDGNTRDINNCLEWVRTRVLTQSPRLDVRSFNSHDKPSLLFTAGRVPPKVLFCGHLDVVEAPKKEFHASLIDSTRIRGRGTADMKGPIAALLDIMATEPISGVGLLLTTDEEVGGENGTNHVLQNLDWKPEVVVLPDGGANMHLVVEQKGMLRLRITAKGVAAHSSRPWLSDNPFKHIYHAHDDLLRAYPTPKSEDDWGVSIALTEMYGGVAPNSVPWHAEATLDIRYPDQGEEHFKHMLADIRQRLAQHDILANVASKSPGFRLDTALPVLRRLQDVATYVRHEKLPLAREVGASDARYFADVPVLMFQPECANWHGADEWVNLESLASFRALCLGFARSMLKGERAYQVANTARKTGVSAHKRIASR